MDRWTLSEPDGGSLCVAGPQLGPTDDGSTPSVEVVAASHLPDNGLYDAGAAWREKAAKIDFTGKVLLDEGRFMGVDHRCKIVVGRKTYAWEEGGTGGYWVWVHDLLNPERQVDYCVYENWWLLDIPEFEEEND